MINRRILIIGLIAILAVALVSWGTKLISKDSARDDEIEIIRSDENDLEVVEDESMRKTVFYFQNGEGYLVPVMRRIPWEEGIAKVTLRNMVDSPELREVLDSTGLLPLLPQGTEIIGMSINQETGLCKVDFSEEILDKESIKDEENLIKGIVYTLTEFPAIKEVQILVNGKFIPALKNGTPVDKPMTRENINLLGKLEDGRSKVVVYYKGNVENEYEYFIPVTIPTLAPMANVYTALDLLFEGPPINSNLTSDIPSGVKLQGVEIKEGTAFVDINLGEESLLTKDTALNSIIKNVGLTLSQFEDIDSVELLVDGEIINATIPVFANEY